MRKNTVSPQEEWDNSLQNPANYECPVCGKRDTENCIETAIICPRKRYIPNTCTHCGHELNSYGQCINPECLMNDLDDVQDDEDRLNDTQIPYSNQGEINPDR